MLSRQSAVNRADTVFVSTHLVETCSRSNVHFQGLWDEFHDWNDRMKNTMSQYGTERSGALFPIGWAKAAILTKGKFVPTRA
jgi:hypothetical protein